MSLRGNVNKLLFPHMWQLQQQCVFTYMSANSAPFIAPFVWLRKKKTIIQRKGVKEKLECLWEF